jgi:hypothetical protein
MVTRVSGNGNEGVQKGAIKGSKRVRKNWSKRFEKVENDVRERSKMAFWRDRKNGQKGRKIS